MLLIGFSIRFVGLDASTNDRTKATRITKQIGCANPKSNVCGSQIPILWYHKSDNYDIMNSYRV